MKLFKNGISAKWLLLIIGIVAVSGVAIAVTNPSITDSGASFLDALNVTNNLWAAYHHGDGTNLTGVAKTGSANTYSQQQIYANGNGKGLQWKNTTGVNSNTAQWSGDNFLLGDLDNNGLAIVLYGGFLGGFRLLNIKSAAQSNALCYDSGGLNNMTYNSGQTTCTASSEKVKHQIETMNSTNTPDNFMKIRPVTFIYNHDNQNRTRDGIIAQEICPLYPGVCNIAYSGNGTFVKIIVNATTGKGQGALYTDGTISELVGVDYELYTSILTKKIQDQQFQLDTQSAQIRNICTNNPTLCS